MTVDIKQPPSWVALHPRPLLPPEGTMATVSSGGQVGTACYTYGKQKVCVCVFSFKWGGGVEMIKSVLQATTAVVISHCGPSTATTVSEPVLIFRRQLRKRSKIRIVSLTQVITLLKLLHPNCGAVFTGQCFLICFPSFLAIYACVCMCWSECLTV